MKALQTAIAALVLLAAASVASATDWDLYPNLRHVSGLPGNGLSVTSRGDFGGVGASHMNVPCAYTPAANNYAVSYYSASMDSRWRVGFGSEETDGTATIAVGLGKPGKGIYLSEIFLDTRSVNRATNVQFQLQDETREMPAIAIGCLDLFDERMDAWGQRHGARSLYVVATRQADPGVPVYVSLGFGNHRFNDGLFGAVNWWPDAATTIGFEYDGFVPRPFVTYRVPDSGPWGLTVGAAWSDFSRPVLGASFSYTKP